MEKWAIICMRSISTTFTIVGGGMGLSVSMSVRASAITGTGALPRFCVPSRGSANMETTSCIGRNGVDFGNVRGNVRAGTSVGDSTASSIGMSAGSAVVDSLCASMRTINTKGVASGMETSESVNEDFEKCVKAEAD